MKHVILASSSPRRRQLLGQTGLKFDVIASEYEEDNTLPLPPAELVQHLAQGKAHWVAQDHPSSLVIGADTLVVLGDRVLGKPAGPAEVRAMIAALSGHWHTVVTGLAIVHGGQVVTDVSETRVHLRELSASEIDRYGRLSEPLDKAGAYGIQYTGGLFVDRLEGDYSGVVGLPMATLARRLLEFGIDLLDFAGH